MKGWRFWGFLNSFNFSTSAGDIRALVRNELIYHHQRASLTASVARITVRGLAGGLLAKAGSDQ